MRRGLTIACLALLACVGTAVAQDPQHNVNGVTLEPEISAALMQAYGPIPSGDYWYDGYTGFWGVSGGPSIGRIMPGLDFGAPLPPHASGGGGYNKSTLFGGLMSDGQCSGYLHPGGATVMTGNC